MKLVSFFSGTLSITVSFASGIIVRMFLLKQHKVTVIQKLIQKPKEKPYVFGAMTQCRDMHRDKNYSHPTHSRRFNFNPHPSLSSFTPVATHPFRFSIPSHLSPQRFVPTFYQACCCKTLWIICRMSHAERSSITNLNCDICTTLTELCIKEQLNMCYCCTC